MHDQVGTKPFSKCSCHATNGKGFVPHNSLVYEETNHAADWRRGSSDIEERDILALFADDPRAPYSIHKFVEHGAAACGNIPENGLGLQPLLVVSSEEPANNTIIYLYLLTSSRALTNGHELSDLKVYITGDGSDVYEDTFMSIAKPDNSSFKPTLILVGTRLGLDKITPVYWEALKASLQMSQSIGIAGYVLYS
jgi:cysteine protease ATG4